MALLVKAGGPERAAWVLSREAWVPTSECETSSSFKKSTAFASGSAAAAMSCCPGRAQTHASVTQVSKMCDSIISWPSSVMMSCLRPRPFDDGLSVVRTELCARGPLRSSSPSACCVPALCLCRPHLSLKVPARQVETRRMLTKAAQSCRRGLSILSSRGDGSSQRRCLSQAPPAPRTQHTQLGNVGYLHYLGRGCRRHGRWQLRLIEDAQGTWSHGVSVRARLKSTA